MRLVFMFMICLVHAVGCQDARWRCWLTNLSFAGVLGFVLISGFHGIRFSWKKVLKIEGVGLGCALTVISVAAIYDPAVFSLSTFAHEVLRLFKGYWFVHAYVVMMALAGISNVEKIERRVIPIVVMVFVWSFCAHVPGVQKYFPKTSGLEPFSGITLFAVYLVGRLYQLQDWDRKLKTGRVILGTLFCGLMVASVVWPTTEWIGSAARYNSPFLLGFAIGLFWLLRRIPLAASPIVLRLLAFITPSVFSVYLIHCNDYGKSVFVWLESCLASCGITSYPAYILLAVVAFFGGVILDLPRRLIVRLAYSCLRIHND